MEKDEIEDAIEILREVAWDKEFPGAVGSVDHQGVCIEACRQLEAFKRWQSMDMSNETN